jgi:hypothetical protein
VLNGVSLRTSIVPIIPDKGVLQKMSKKKEHFFIFVIYSCGVRPQFMAHVI